jgi:hypothetical protein
MRRISRAEAASSASLVLSRGSASSVSQTVERPRRCRPISTFSNTLLLWKMLVRWNVRTKPSAVTSCGFNPLSRVPR